ncbi:MAG: HD domain-containing protein [Clostridia bacterium]|nr:HD domain-containing protein [Clostridia bacterium]
MEIKQIAETIKQNGGTLYLVGGAIRDELIGKPIYDRDYCVCGISKEDFVRLFPEAKVMGKSFEVFCINNEQFALARREIKKGLGHKEFEIETGTSITIKEDLARRDITINAMAKDVLTNEIIDPFGGGKDIKNKIIRATTDAFCEDPLRVYRVARIAAQTGFYVEENTLRKMENLKKELLTLSKERVFIELKKALESEKPSIFFDTLRKANVLEVHFKEIYDLIGSLQPKEYHPEGDSYNHTMIVVDKSAELTNDIGIRFACLVHDLGKGVTPKEMYPHHYGHDEKGVKLVENFGNRINVPNIWKSYGKVAAKEHMKGGIFSKMSPSKKVQFIERVGKTKLGLDGLQIVVIADKCSTRDTKLENISFADLGKKCLIEVNGKTVKAKYPNLEGEKFKEKLHSQRVEWMKKNSF